MPYEIESMLWGFETIDKRKVPFTKPQHGKDGGYVVTSHENPLPNANYVQTAAGIWVPNKGSDDGSANVEVKNLPTTQTVDGSVSITNDEANAVPTKLTGSKVKLAEAVDLEIPAGSSADVVSDVDVPEIKSIHGGVFLSGGGDFDFRFFGYGENTSYSPLSDDRVSSQGENIVNLSTDKVFRRFRSRIYNDSLEDKQFRCEIWGEK